MSSHIILCTPLSQSHVYLVPRYMILLVLFLHFYGSLQLIFQKSLKKRIYFFQFTNYAAFSESLSEIHHFRSNKKLPVKTAKKSKKKFVNHICIFQTLIVITFLFTFLRYKLPVATPRKISEIILIIFQFQLAMFFQLHGTQQIEEHRKENKTQRRTRKKTSHI